MNPEELATKAQELQQLYQAGGLTNAEFKELVNDLIVVQTINNAALELEENLNTRNIIVGVINFASMVV